MFPNAEIESHSKNKYPLRLSLHVKDNDSNKKTKVCMFDVLSPFKSCNSMQLQPSAYIPQLLFIAHDLSFLYILQNAKQLIFKLN